MASHDIGWSWCVPSRGLGGSGDIKSMGSQALETSELCACLGTWIAPGQCITTAPVLLPLLPQGADPNLPNHDGWHALDLACDLNKLGKVVVKQQHVPVHALLVGWGAVNSDAFRAQVRRDPAKDYFAKHHFSSVVRLGLL